MKIHPKEEFELVQILLEIDLGEFEPTGICSYSEHTGINVLEKNRKLKILHNFIVLTFKYLGDCTNIKMYIIEKGNVKPNPVLNLNEQIIEKCMQSKYFIKWQTHTSGFSVYFRYPTDSCKF